MNRTSKIPEHSQETVDALMAFIRKHALRSAHYFGHADRGVILALKNEPGFELGVTDYYDRWHRSIHFWEGDEVDLSGPECAVPGWLNGVTTYEEGHLDTSCLVYDLAPDEQHGDFQLVEFLDAPSGGFWKQRISNVALLRVEPPPLGNFSWMRSAGLWLGEISTVDA
jgi:hypothetical protein